MSDSSTPKSPLEAVAQRCPGKNSTSNTADIVPSAASSNSLVAHAPPPSDVNLHKNSFVEFCRGAAASATNIIITFPLNKLISRQAYEGLSVRDAFHTMRVEGAANIYRGVGPPLLQKGVSMGIMYGTYDFYFHALTYMITGRVESRVATDIPVAESSWRIKAIAAILSGSTEGLLTPFERMQTILQHRHYTDQFSNAWDVARKLRPYGLQEYFRGGTAILLRNGPANAIFFVLREPLKELLPPLSPTADDSDSPSSDDDPKRRDGGGGGGGNGLPTDSSPLTHCVPSAPRGLPAPPNSRVRPLSALVTAGAPLHSLLAWDAFRDFCTGSILGATISTVFYPLNMAKSVMQLQIGGRFRGVWETLKQVAHERNGVAGMYRGAGVNVFRSFLSWGIVNASYGLYRNVFVARSEPQEAELR